MRHWDVFFISISAQDLSEALKMITLQNVIPLCSSKQTIEIILEVVSYYYFIFCIC